MVGDFLAQIAAYLIIIVAGLLLLPLRSELSQYASAPLQNVTTSSSTTFRPTISSHTLIHSPIHLFDFEIDQLRLDKL